MRTKPISILMRLAGSLLAAAALTVASGCIPPLTGLTNLFPSERLDEVTVVGGTAGQAIFARTRYPDPPAGFDPLDVLTGEFDPSTIEYEPPRTEIVRVNLRTLQSEPLLSDLPVGSYGLKTDGRWLAWFDWEESSVRIVDLDSAEQRSLFAEAGDGPIRAVAVVQNSYLVLEAGPLYSATTALLAVNLETNEQTFISPAHLDYSYISSEDRVGSVSVNGDRLAMVVAQSIETEEDLSRPTRRTIDMVDLPSGDRSTLVADVDRESNPVLLLEADRLLVLDSTYGPSIAVRAYPLDGGDPQTLLTLELASGFQDFGSVNGFNTNGLVVQTSHSGPLLSFSGNETFDFHPLDGAAVRIFEYVYDLFSINRNILGSPVPFFRQVDEYVVYRETDRSEFVVFDVTGQTERRFDPFGR